MGSQQRLHELTDMQVKELVTHVDLALRLADLEAWDTWQTMANSPSTEIKEARKASLQGRQLPPPGKSLSSLSLTNLYSLTYLPFFQLLTYAFLTYNHLPMRRSIG